MVGPNGAGKTTFIKLLCRLYDPTEGRITLNGVDIRKYDEEEYRDLFGVVFQDFKLFAFPVICNPVVFYLNEALFAEKNIPLPGHDWTWAEFLDISLRLKAEGILPLLLLPIRGSLQVSRGNNRLRTGRPL